MQRIDLVRFATASPEAEAAVSSAADSSISGAARLSSLVRRCSEWSPVCKTSRQNYEAARRSEGSSITINSVASDSWGSDSMGSPRGLRLGTLGLLQATEAEKCASEGLTTRQVTNRAGGDVENGSVAMFHSEGALPLHIHQPGIMLIVPTNMRVYSSPTLQAISIL
jgi:hypothetical protein